MLNSNFVMVWGKNPANTSPHFMEFLKGVAKKQREIILIDPIKTRTASVCTEHYQINPSTDKYLALALAKIIIEEDLVDFDFVKKHTIGYDDFRKLALSVDIGFVSSICRIPEDKIHSLAMKYIKNKPSSIWLGFGLQRYVDGAETVRVIDALGAISGNVGIPGGGVNHQNSEVQKYFDYDVNLENTIIDKRRLRKAAIAEDLKKATPPIKRRTNKWLSIPEWERWRLKLRYQTSILLML